MILGCHDLVEVNDVRVMELPMMVDLASQVGGRRFGNLLDRTPRPSQAVSGKMDGAIRT